MFVDRGRIIIEKSNETHLYLRPHKKLRTLIAHYTCLMETKFHSHQDTLMLVPDAAGCITMQDIGHGLECMLWGATTHCVQVAIQRTQMRFHFFIEFLPTAAFTLFQHSQQPFLNQRIPLQEIHRELYEMIRCAYDACETLEAFVCCMDEALLSLMHEGKDGCVGFMQKQLHKGHDIQSIITNIGYSRRHVQRMFQEQMGCTMKDYQRVERINQAVVCMQRGMRGSEIAQQCGYHDQSHFIHDFTKVCKLTPQQYIAKMSEFYNEEIKFSDIL